MPRIAILIHQTDAFKAMRYFMHAIASTWHERGVQLVLQKGLGPIHAVDLAVMHVDRTVTPEPYRQMIAQYPHVLNGRVLDISKRTVSRYLVEQGDGYDGPVVVKTNRNYGGLQELYETNPTVDEETVRKLLHYQVLPSVADVPAEFWSDPTWVVERFMSERSDELYCLRTWVFLGDKETNSICYGTKPIVKSRNIVRRERVADVPGELREIRQRMGFDFGKFDYAIVGGEVVLYDANRTPSLGNFESGAMASTIELLADGLHSYL